MESEFKEKERGIAGIFKIGWGAVWWKIDKAETKSDNLQGVKEKVSS